MFTAIAFNKSSWLEQKNHGFSIDTRPVLDHFPLVYRRPNEDLSKNERKTNEKLSKTRRKNAKPDENGRLQFPDSFWLCQTRTKRPRNAFNSLLSKGCQLQQPDPEWHQAVHG